MNCVANGNQYMGVYTCTLKVLEEIEPLIAKQSTNKKKLQELSSRFYTIIPHDFGRRTPPVIADEETLRNKFDMLLVSV